MLHACYVQGKDACMCMSIHVCHQPMDVALVDDMHKINLLQKVVKDCTGALIVWAAFVFLKFVSFWLPCCPPLTSLLHRKHHLPCFSKVI